jgi:hypothetical protein
MASPRKPIRRPDLCADCALERDRAAPVPDPAATVLPRLARGHVPVLRAVLAAPGITAPELGERLYQAASASRRGFIARLELDALSRLRLVEHDAGHPRRWSPALFAAEALRLAETP